MDDESILEHAAAEGRIVLTHDLNTLIGHAVARIAAGEGMPGVFAVPQTAPLARVIAEC